MAPAVSSSSKPEDDEVPVEEIVFSCSVCQATVSDVYATVESNHGFHSGSGDDDGIVTKMWIGDCSHIFCGKHLENGAAPFHPKDQPPRAPCPKCLKDRRDDTSKDLYRIQGLARGEYDPAIPEVWLKCPAMKLDTSIPGMDAVRFQYMALSHYGVQVRKHWKNAMQRQAAMEAAYSKERKARRQVQSELLESKNRIEVLKTSEANLKKWEDRKPVIDHYLKAFGRMAKDNEDMRMQLLHLGYNVPDVKYAFEPESFSRSITIHPPQNLQPGQSGVNALSKGLPARHEQAESSSSARKRKRDVYQDTMFDKADTQQQRHRGSSRDLMPPPLPKYRPPQRTPDVYQELYGTHAAPTGPVSRQSIQMYEDGAWRSEPPQVPVQSRETHQNILQHFSGTRFPEEMPLQQSQAQQTMPRELEPQRPRLNVPSARDEVASRYGEAHNAYDPQSFAQLSLQSPKRNALPSQPVHRGQQPVYEPNIRTTQTDLRYESTGTAQGGRAKDEYSEIARVDQPRYVVPNSRSYNTRATPVPQPSSQAPMTSVISPFFKRGVVETHPTPLQRPRENYIRPQHVNTGRETRNMNGYQVAPERDPARPAIGEMRSLNGLSFINRPHRPADHRPLYESPATRTGIVSSHQHHAFIPQTPRNSQGLFQRLDQPLPPGSFAPTKPQSNMNAYRLPPAHGPRMPVAASQDEALSQIRGVRGVSSQRHYASYQRTGPTYESTRPLFSSAGGRRSVRR